MKRFGVKFWRVILGILCICIVVLGVWVVVTVMDRENENTPMDDYVELDALNDIRSTAYKMASDDAIEYLNTKMDENKNNNLWFQILLLKIYKLDGSGFKDKAVNEASIINENSLSLSEKTDYYRMMASIYNGYDEVSSEEYQKLFIENYLQLHNGGAGLE